MIKSLKDLLDKFSRFTNSLVYDGGICKRLKWKNEYLESFEITNIIKERSINKNESTKMITQDQMLNYLENKLKSSTI